MVLLEPATADDLRGCREMTSRHRRGKHRVVSGIHVKRRAVLRIQCIYGVAHSFEVSCCVAHSFGVLRIYLSRCVANMI